MENYIDMKERHQKEVNELPIMWAFSNAQFTKGLAKLGLTEKDTGKLCSLQSGGFILKTDAPMIKETVARHKEEFKTAIESDTVGDGFIFQAFNYELANHEYIVTYDPDDAIYALGLTRKMVEESPAMKEGLRLAINMQRDY